MVAIQPPPRRHLSASSTQTEVSEFLDLRQLQLASSQQQQQLHQLRSDLQQAQSSSAVAVVSTAQSTAAERDEHYRSLTRHLERTHKQALENERTASAAKLANELLKQRETLQRTILDQFHEETTRRERQLDTAQRELVELRSKLSKREEEVADLQTDLSRDRAALEVERERVQELETTLETERIDREEERQTRERAGFYVEATELHAVEGQVIHLTGLHTRMHTHAYACMRRWSI